MPAFYKGIFMGVSKQYWTEIIMKIHAMSGPGGFNWGEVMRKHPDITKSELSRLKCSNFLMQQKTSKREKTPIQWKVNPDVLRYIESQSFIKKRIYKKIK